MSEQIVQATDIIYPHIGYKGSVEIHYVNNINGELKVIKKQNKGELGLFCGLIEALGGQADFRTYLPSTIMGYYEDIYGNEIEAFSQPIPFISAPIFYNNDNQTADMPANAIQYSFTVPFSSLTQQETEIHKLVLCNSVTDKKLIEEGLNKCATLSFDPGDGIATSIASNILVYWRLKFENITVQENQ